MKKGTVIALIVATACTVTGLCLSAAAFIGIGFDLRKLNNTQPRTNRHTVTDEFSGIDIQAVEADISLLPAEDNVCRVVCEETDKITHTVAVTNGKLTVTHQDSRRWYERIFHFSFRKLSVSVYLPAGEYKKLAIKTVSGDVSVSASLRFADAAFSSTSGSITCAAQTKGSLTASTVSGDITLSEHTGGPLSVSTTSGEISLRDINASTISVNTTSGDMALTDVVANGLLEAQSVSGEQSFTRTDAGSLALSSVSGNLTVTLLSDKDFSYNTASGHVSLPRSIAGAGTCKIKTTSGNIRISIAD